MKHVWEDSVREGNRFWEVGVDDSIILKKMLNKLWSREYG
jgi:hypothetical protein